MRDLLGRGSVLGYCTNVHAGTSWAQSQANLLRHAPAVRRAACPGELMGVGLWLSAASARQLIEGERIGVLRDLLAENGLFAYTLNGFPHGDFHQPVVKHSVYEPDWSEYERVQFTRDLVTILDGILPRGATGSISTLPVGWRRTFRGRPQRLDDARKNLLRLAEHLQRLERETNRLIHVDLEPEPGCVLQRGRDVVSFFKKYLLPGSDALDVKRYLRVCHDVCHAAVMFEDQPRVIAAYDRAGIEVGKVQVSAALRVDFDRLNDPERRVAAAELAAFHERRYLHQTVVRDAAGRVAFFQDLPEALKKVGPEQVPVSEWRVHFHVPIYADRVGAVETTRPQIREAIDLLRGRVEHWEVETYAWGVLPAAMATETLAEGISRELAWLRDVASAPAPAP